MSGAAAAIPQESGERRFAGCRKMPASRGTPDGAGLWPAFPVVAQERRCLRGGPAMA